MQTGKFNFTSTKDLLDQIQTHAQSLKLRNGKQLNHTTVGIETYDGQQSLVIRPAFETRSGRVRNMNPIRIDNFAEFGDGSMFRAMGHEIVGQDWIQSNGGVAELAKQYSAGELFFNAVAGSLNKAVDNYQGSRQWTGPSWFQRSFAESFRAEVEGFGTSTQPFEALPGFIQDRHLGARQVIVQDPHKLSGKEANSLMDNWAVQRGLIRGYDVHGNDDGTNYRAMMQPFTPGSNWTFQGETGGDYNFWGSKTMGADPKLISRYKMEGRNRAFIEGRDLIDAGRFGQFQNVTVRMPNAGEPLFAGAAIASTDFLHSTMHEPTTLKRKMIPNDVRLSKFTAMSAGRYTGGQPVLGNYITSLINPNGGNPITEDVNNVIEGERTGALGRDISNVRLSLGTGKATVKMLGGLLKDYNAMENKPLGNLVFDTTRGKVNLNAMVENFAGGGLRTRHTDEFNKELAPLFGKVYQAVTGKALDFSYGGNSRNRTSLVWDESKIYNPLDAKGAFGAKAGMAQDGTLSPALSGQGIDMILPPDTIKEKRAFGLSVLGGIYTTKDQRFTQAQQWLHGELGQTSVENIFGLDQSRAEGLLGQMDSFLPRDPGGSTIYPTLATFAPEYMSKESKTSIDTVQGIAGASPVLARSMFRGASRTAWSKAAVMQNTGGVLDISSHIGDSGLGFSNDMGQAERMEMIGSFLDNVGKEAGVKNIRNKLLTYTHGEQQYTLAPYNVMKKEEGALGNLYTAAFGGQQQMEPTADPNRVGDAGEAGPPPVTKGEILDRYTEGMSEDGAGFRKSLGYVKSNAGGAFRYTAGDVAPNEVALGPNQAKMIAEQMKAPVEDVIARMESKRGMAGVMHGWPNVAGPSAVTYRYNESLTQPQVSRAANIAHRRDDDEDLANFMVAERYRDGKFTRNAGYKEFTAHTPNMETQALISLQAMGGEKAFAAHVATLGKNATPQDIINSYNPSIMGFGTKTQNPYIDAAKDLSEMKNGLPGFLTGLVSTRLEEGDVAAARNLEASLKKQMGLWNPQRMIETAFNQRQDDINKAFPNYGSALRGVAKDIAASPARMLAAGTGRIYQSPLDLVKVDQDLDQSLSEIHYTYDKTVSTSGIFNTFQQAGLGEIDQRGRRPEYAFEPEQLGALFGKDVEGMQAISQSVSDFRSGAIDRGTMRNQLDGKLGGAMEDAFQMARAYHLDAAVASGAAVRNEDGTVTVKGADGKGKVIPSNVVGDYDTAKAKNPELYNKMAQMYGRKDTRPLDSYAAAIANDPTAAASVGRTLNRMGISSGDMPYNRAPAPPTDSLRVNTPDPVPDTQPPPPSSPPPPAGGGGGGGASGSGGGSRGGGGGGTAAATPSGSSEGGESGGWGRNKHAGRPYRGPDPNQYSAGRSSTPVHSGGSFTPEQMEQAVFSGQIKAMREEKREQARAMAREYQASIFRPPESPGAFENLMNQVQDTGNGYTINTGTDDYMNELENISPNTASMFGKLEAFQSGQLGSTQDRLGLERSLTRHIAASVGMFGKESPQVEKLKAIYKDVHEKNQDYDGFKKDLQAKESQQSYNHLESLAGKLGELNDANGVKVVGAFLDSLKKATDVNNKFSEGLEKAIPDVAAARDSIDEIKDAASNLQKNLASAAPYLNESEGGDSIIKQARKVIGTSNSSVTKSGAVGKYVTEQFGEEGFQAAAGDGSPNYSRLLNGALAFQMARAYRYTTVPFEQAAQQYQSAFSNVSSTMSAGGMGFNTMNMPTAQLNRMTGDFAFGVGRGFSPIMGGVSTLLSALTGGNTSDLGGLVGGVGAPAAMGIGGAMVTAQIGAALGKSGTGLIKAAPLVGTAIGAAATLTGLVGAGADVNNFGRQTALRDTKGSLAAFLSDPLGYSGAGWGYAFGDNDVGGARDQRRASAQLYDSVKGRAMNGDPVNLSQMSPDQRRAYMELTSDSSSYFSKLGASYGLKNETTMQLLGSTAMRSGKGNLDTAIFNRLARGMQVGENSSDLIGAADRLAQTLGSTSVLGGNDLLISGRSLTDITQEDYSRNLMGGQSNIEDMVFGGMVGNVQEGNALLGQNLQGLTPERASLVRSYGSASRLMSSRGVRSPVQQKLLANMSRLHGMGMDQLLSIADTAAMRGGDYSPFGGNNVFASMSNPMATMQANSNWQAIGGQQTMDRMGAMGLGGLASSMVGGAALNPMQAQAMQGLAMMNPVSLSQVLYNGGSASQAISANVPGAAPLTDMSGQQLFRNNMEGLSNPKGGFYNTPTVGQIGGFFRATLPGQTRGLLSGGGGYQSHLNNVMAGNVYQGMGGMMALQQESNVVSYQAAMASAGIQMAQIREGRRYQLETEFPLQETNMQLDRAADFGGTVQSDYMKKKGIAPVSFTGKWNRERARMALDEKDMQANMSQQLTRLDWQAADLSREWSHSQTRAGWQREDFALQAGQMAMNRQYQMQQFAYQQQDIQLNRQYMREDYAYGKQVRQMQFTWQQEDSDTNIRRATGFQRRQLVKERDRNVQMHNVEEKHTDDLKKRDEDASKRQEDRLKKEIDHYKQVLKYEDISFKNQKDRFEQENKWRDEDFGIKLGRIGQEKQWAQEAFDRQVARMDLRKKEMEEEENQARTQHDLKAAAFEDEKTHAKTMYELNLAAAGVGAEAARKQFQINQDMLALQRIEEDRQKAIEKWVNNTNWTYIKQVIDAWIAMSKGLSGTVGSQGDSSGDDTDQSHHAKGGKVKYGRPYVVGEHGPELVIPGKKGAEVVSGKSVALKPDVYYRPDKDDDIVRYMEKKFSNKNAVNAQMFYSNARMMNSGLSANLSTMKSDRQKSDYIADQIGVNMAARNYSEAAVADFNATGGMSSWMKPPTRSQTPVANPLSSLIQRGQQMLGGWLNNMLKPREAKQVMPEKEKPVVVKIDGKNVAEASFKYGTQEVSKQVRRRYR